MMIRRLFELRSPRERLLMTVFLWLALLLWLVLSIRWWRNALYQHALASDAVAEQQIYINEANSIDERLAGAQAMIDPTRTLTSTQLFSAVDGLARESGLPADIRSPESSEEGIFNTHRVRVDVRRASLEQLMTFTQAVRQQAPYLALRNFAVRANGRDPKQLDAVVVVESFELTQRNFQ